ncbi:hypothetical protein [Ensifer adhaerens]
MRQSATALRACLTVRRKIAILVNHLSTHGNVPARPGFKGHAEFQSEATASAQHLTRALGNRRRTDMGASQAAVAIATPSALPAGDGGIPMGLLELELSLDGFSGNNADFTSFVRTVADNVGGEFLFALPASDLIEDCRSIAVLRLPDAGGDASILFACLDEQGRAVRIEHPSDTTRDLERFAESFVGVLERM